MRLNEVNVSVQDRHFACRICDRAFKGEVGPWNHIEANGHSYINEVTIFCKEIAITR